jgi:hypothetical protein
MIHPAQVPGSLFVIVLLVHAIRAGNHSAMLLLAVGCAAAWITESFFPPDAYWRVSGVFITLLIFATAFLSLAYGVLF